MPSNKVLIPFVVVGVLCLYIDSKISICKAKFFQVCAFCVVQPIVPWSILLLPFGCVQSLQTSITPSQLKSIYVMAINFSSWGFHYYSLIIVVILAGLSQRISPYMRDPTFLFLPMINSEARCCEMEFFCILAVETTGNTFYYTCIQQILSKLLRLLQQLM